MLVDDVNSMPVTVTEGEYEEDTHEVNPLEKELDNDEDTDTLAHPVTVGLAEAADVKVFLPLGDTESRADTLWRAEAVTCIVTVADDE